MCDSQLSLAHTLLHAMTGRTLSYYLFTVGATKAMASQLRYQYKDWDNDNYYLYLTKVLSKQYSWRKYIVRSRWSHIHTTLSKISNLKLLQLFAFGAESFVSHLKTYPGEFIPRIAGTLQRDLSRKLFHYTLTQQLIDLLLQARGSHTIAHPALLVPCLRLAVLPTELCQLIISN